MGCFSVACGVSRLSITAGDKCVLIPITAKKEFQPMTEQELREAADNLLTDDLYKRNPHAKHETTHLFVNNDELWEPCLLPIRGEYDDYGSIEEIEEDENTRAIERYYGVSINDFVSLITDGRKNVYDDYSLMYDHFFKYKEMHDNDNDIGILSELFEQVDDTHYRDSRFMITVDMDEEKFTVDQHIRGLSGDYDLCQILSFLENYYKATGILLGVKDKEKYNEIMCIGGMFVLADVYDRFAKLRPAKKSNIIMEQYPDAEFLLDNGFLAKEDENGSTCYVKKVDDVGLVVDPYKRTLNGEKTYDVKSFCSQYKKLTGKRLPQSRFDGMDEAELTKYFVENYTKEICIEDIKTEALLEDKEVDTTKEEDVEKWLFQNEKRFVSALEYLKNKCFLLKTNDILCKIYAVEILFGRCMEEYTEMSRFYRAARLLNTIWVPSFCGTQCGCLEAEIKLRDIINEVVKKRLNELMDEDRDRLEKTADTSFFGGFY